MSAPLPNLSEWHKVPEDATIPAGATVAFRHHADGFVGIWTPLAAPLEPKYREGDTDYYTAGAWLSPSLTVRAENLADAFAATPRPMLASQIGGTLRGAQQLHDNLAELASIVALLADRTESR